MAFEEIGARAVVENVAGFMSSIDRMIAKTKAFVDTSVAGFTKMKESSGKYMESLDTGSLKLMFAKDNVDKFAQSIQTSTTKMGLAIAGAGAAITAGLGMMTKAAVTVDSTRIAFENLAKSNQQSSADILDALKKASSGTIEANSLMLSANRAMTLGVAKNIEQFTSLMEIARDRARSMGLSTAQAFDNIVTGIGRGSPLILDNLGIIVNVTDANEKYAKSLNKTAAQLTEAEKQQALLNEVLKQGQSGIDKTAQATMTASETMQALKASTSDLFVSIGSVLLPVLQTGAKLISDVVSGTTKWTAANPILTKILVGVTAATGLLLTAVGGLILALPTLISLQTSAGAVMSGSAFKTAAQTASLIAQAAAHTVVAVALKISTAAQYAYNAAIKSNPMTIAFTAIMALVSALSVFAIAAGKSKKSTDDLNQSVKEYEPPVNTAIAKTEAWKNALIELNKIQGKTAKDEKDLNDVRKAFYDRFGIQINQLTDEILAKNASIKSTMAYKTAVKDAENGNKSYYEGVLKKTKATQYDINYMEAYDYALNKVVQTNKNTVTSLQSLIDWQSKISGLQKSFADSQTAAGQFGLTVDDVTNYMIANGRAAELMAIPTENLAGVLENAQTYAEYFNLSLGQIALSAENNTSPLAKFAAEVEKLNQAFQSGQTEAGKLGISLENIITYLLAIEKTPAQIDDAFEQYGTDVMKWADGMHISLQELSEMLDITKGDMILSNKEAEEFTKTAKELAQKYVESEKTKLNDVLSAERESHQTRLDNLRDEYDAAIENIDNILNAQLDAYDEQLDALDEQLSEIEGKQKASNDAQTKADLELSISTEYDLKRKAELNKELDALIVASGNTSWQKQRQTDLEALIAAETDADMKAEYEKELAQYTVDLDLATQKSILENQKDTIKDERDAAEKKASDDKKRLKTTYDYNVDLENKAYDNFETNIENRKIALDTELTQTLARYDADLASFKKANFDKLADTMKFVTDMNAELDKLKDRTIVITTVQRTIVESSGNPDDSGVENLTNDPGSTGITNPDFWTSLASGGKVRARAGGRLIRAGEGGQDEYVIPANKLDKLVSSLLSFSSSSIQAILPAGSVGNVNNSRSVNDNVNAHYSKPQDPQNLRLDLEALAMMARS
jgi:hypothetical protein